jgi:hypothetical protein
MAPVFLDAELPPLPSDGNSVEEALPPGTSMVTVVVKTPFVLVKVESDLVEPAAPLLATILPDAAFAAHPTKEAP